MNKLLKYLTMPLLDTGEGSGGSGAMGLPTEATPTAGPGVTPSQAEPKPAVPSGTETPAPPAAPTGTPATEPASPEGQPAEESFIEGTKVNMRDYQKRYQDLIGYLKVEHPDAVEGYRSTYPNAKPRDDQGRFVAPEPPPPPAPPEPTQVDPNDLSDPEKFLEYMAKKMAEVVDSKLSEREQKTQQARQQEAWEKERNSVRDQLNKFMADFPDDVQNQAWERANATAEEIAGMSLSEIIKGPGGPTRVGRAVAKALNDILSEQNAGLRQTEAQAALAAKAKEGLLATQPGAAAPPSPAGTKTKQMEQLEKMQNADPSATAALMSQFAESR